MGGISGKAAPVLDPKTHELASKPTGTLIYNFHTNDMAKAKSTNVPEGTFYGLDVDYDELDLHDTIGHGTYGKVYKAHYQGTHIAVKKIFLSVVPAERAEIMEDFAKEIKILSILHHKCIIQFLGACRRDPNYCLLFELCEGSVGSLLAMIRKKKFSVTWRMCLNIARDCAEAVEYLHNLTPKILHRDLKAENLLLNENFNCKLTDFGLSRGYETKSVMTVCGTPCWVAPEIFLGEAYTCAVDVYSFAIVLWELFCFNKPYSNKDCVELPYLVAKEGLRPPLLTHVPDSINELMESCWHADMNKRPSFTEIKLKLDDIIKECEPFLLQAIEINNQ